MAVFLYVLLVYLSLPLSLILIPQKLAYYLTFSLDTNNLRMSVLKSSYDSFIGIMGFTAVKF